MSKKSDSESSVGDRPSTGVSSSLKVGMKTQHMDFYFFERS